MKTKKMKVSELEYGFFVRKQAFDPDKIKLFADLMEAGEQFPLITISPKGEVTDGRTRLEAHKSLGHTEVDCIEEKRDSKSEYIADAVKANYGTAQPLEKSEMERVVKMLIEEGNSRNKIYDLLYFIPKAVLRVFYSNAITHLKRARKTAAITAILEGSMTREEACKKYGLTIEELKEEVKKGKKSKKGIKQIYGGLGSAARGYAQTKRRLASLVISHLEDGVIDQKQALKYIIHMEETERKLRDRTQEYKDRVQAINGN